MLFLFIPVLAQIAPDLSFPEISEDANEKYGPSAELLNGKKYHYPYRSAKGNPFFDEKGDDNASVQIDGKLYENQTIRYDIYNQMMVLDYKDRSGAPRSIVLRNEWIDYLIIDGYQFKKYPGEDGLERFGQVIHEGNFSCIYFWEKKYAPDLQQGEQHYRFSDPQLQANIVVQDHFYSYSGRRSFLRCFPKTYKAEIKKYMKERRIRIRRVTNPEMKSLMIFINQLSGHED
jgi:hypothetical protein